MIIQSGQVSHIGSSASGLRQPPSGVWYPKDGDRHRATAFSKLVAQNRLVTFLVAIGSVLTQKDRINLVNLMTYNDFSKRLLGYAIVDHDSGSTLLIGQTGKKSRPFDDEELLQMERTIRSIACSAGIGLPRNPAHRITEDKCPEHCRDVTLCLPTYQHLPDILPYWVK